MGRQRHPFLWEDAAPRHLLRWAWDGFPPPVTPMGRSPSKVGLGITDPCPRLSLSHCVSVQDLKGTIITNCLQCSDVLETKSEDDSKFIILTGTNCSTTPGIQEMSHCSVVQIRRSLTWSPQPELSGSSAVAIWGSVPFPQHRRPCRRDRGLERVLAIQGRMRVSSAAL